MITKSKRILSLQIDKYKNIETFFRVSSQMKCLAPLETALKVPEHLLMDCHYWIYL